MADDQPLTDLERTLPPHLGGHFGNTNVDAPTLHYLIARYGVATMLDVGCGPGGMLDIAKSMGLESRSASMATRIWRRRMSSRTTTQPGRCRPSI
jgi:hypothetical protein